MSILINLLPDIRQAKLRERRRRQLVSGISILVWSICGGLVLLLGIFSTGQKVIIRNLDNSIESKKNELKAMTDLPAALTAADHLKSLPELYDKRVYFTNFFKAYEAASPTDVTLQSLSVDASNVVAAKGVARSYAAVAKLARAVEGYNVTVGPDAKSSNTPYFSDVSLQNVSQDTTGVAFTLNATAQSGVFSGN
jgi:Tfp pilus assembly protein PilN